MKTILITGGTGLVGQALIPLLINAGYSIKVPTRTAKTDPMYIQWDGLSPLTYDLMESIQGIIHLAGANVGAQRWTKNYKEEIINSRVLTANHILKSLDQKSEPLDFFISASGIGYYGDCGDELIREDRKNGSDFLAQVCHQWEAAAQAYQSYAKRVVIMRTGIVLSNQGGALNKIIPMAKLGLGQKMGNGDQYWSWIHIEDLIYFITYAVNSSHVNGIYNVCAASTRQAEFASIATNNYRNNYILLPVPIALLRILLGEMASIVLSSQNADNRKLLNTGFSFKYTELIKAFAQLKVG